MRADDNQAAVGIRRVDEFSLSQQGFVFDAADNLRERRRRPEQEIFARRHRLQQGKRENFNVDVISGIDDDFAEVRDTFKPRRYFVDIAAAQFVKAYAGDA